LHTFCSKKCTRQRKFADKKSNGNSQTTEYQHTDQSKASRIDSSTREKTKLKAQTIASSLKI
jgi:hypothetical protein